MRTLKVKLKDILSQTFAEDNDFARITIGLLKELYSSNEYHAKLSADLSKKVGRMNKYIRNLEVKQKEAKDNQAFIVGCELAQRKRVKELEVELQKFQHIKLDITT
jgi:hypothetical protein